MIRNTFRAEIGVIRGERMKNKHSLSFLCIATALLLLFCQGCGGKSDVSNSDLRMVNRYIEAQGAEPMDRKAAESMDRQLFQNRETREIKTAWGLVVDFVDNAESETPKELGYAIEFDRASFSMKTDQWENIGG